MKMFIAVFALVLLLGWWTCWWIILPISFVSAFFCGRSSFFSFVSGSLGAGLAWFVVAATLHIESGGILTQKVATLLGGLPPLSLLFATGLLAATVSGFAACSGYYLRQAFTASSNSESQP